MFNDFFQRNTLPAMVRPSGKQLLIRRLLCGSRVSRDVAQQFQPLLSTNRNEETVL